MLAARSSTAVETTHCGRTSHSTTTPSTTPPHNTAWQAVTHLTSNHSSPTACPYTMAVTKIIFILDFVRLIRGKDVTATGRTMKSGAVYGCTTSTCLQAWLIVLCTLQAWLVWSGKAGWAALGR